MAGTYNFTIEQGATFNRTFTWTDVNQNPINLTGYTAKMSLAATNGAPYITLTNGSGITLGTTNGQIAVAMTATQTAGFTFSSAKYDLKMTDASGNVTRLIEGTVTLDDEVTT